ncbi:MAG TPA: hypothetical protein VLI90_13190 [Tepidisphaeraceae bacterium]|nr:hypothetical protein [Tepidisphaeraceae bacterium]
MIADARAVWEPIYGRALSADEINEIIFNVDGLLRVLFNLKGAVGSSSHCHRQSGEDHDQGRSAE